MYLQNGIGIGIGKNRNSIPQWNRLIQDCFWRSGNALVGEPHIVHFAILTVNIDEFIMWEVLELCTACWCNRSFQLPYLTVCCNCGWYIVHSWRQVFVLRYVRLGHILLSLACHHHRPCPFSICSVFMKVDVVHSDFMRFGGMYTPFPAAILSRWRGGTLGKAFGLAISRSRVQILLVQRCVTTLGKLFTPMCLCHQAV